MGTSQLRPGTDTTAAAVVREGRTQQARRGRREFLLVLSLLLYLVAAHWCARALDDTTAALALPWPVVATWSALLVLMAGRAALFTASASILDGDTTGGPASLVGAAEDTPDGDPALRRSRLLLACSGGGIKSASFCLGALSALHSRGIYQSADRLYAVSGGGYAASAFTLAAEGGARPFGASSEELRTLRTRTNYLVASRGVRFELYVSLLVGVAHALLLITVFGGLGLWLVSPFLGHALVASGAGTARTWHTGTGFTGLWLVPSVVLVVTTGTALLMRGLRGRADDSPRRDRTGRPDLGEDAPGRGPRGSGGAPFAEALRGWPVTLSGWAVGWLLLVPGSVLLAIGLQEVSSALPTALTDHAEGLRAALTGGALTSVLALVASTWKGLWRPRGSDSFTGAVLGAFRRVIAPRLALAILLVVLLSAGGEVLTGLVVSSGSGSAWWGTRSVVVPILAALAFVATSSLGPNATSMFPFYRAQLQYAYLDTTQTSAAVPRVVRRNPGLTALPERALRPDIPALHLLGTVNSADDDLVPTGRHGLPFVFSRDTVGVTSLGAAGQPVLTTPERLGRERRTMATRRPGGVPVTLSEAMAVSAAAVAPMAGREAGLRAYRVLFALLNVRLGVWLPNPAWAQLPRETTPWRRMLRWAEWRTSFPKGGVPLAEAVGTASAFAPWLYVTDGGHFDNLGLVEALRDVRAARSPGSGGAPAVVIVLDGSGDQEDDFPTMGRAIATARMELGVEVRFDPRWMTRGTASHPDRVWSVATAHRADAPADEQPVCTIVYLKCILPREVPWDLRTYAASHDGFPATSSSLEVYDEFDFEAFRRLGVAVVDAAASEGAFATLDTCTPSGGDDTAADAYQDGPAGRPR